MGELKDGYLIMGNWLNDWYDKNKAHFWTGVSMVGTVATAVASAEDTKRIFRKSLKEHGCDPKDLPVKDRLRLYATNYAMTAGCIGISIFGAGKSDKENGKIIAERTGLYLATRKGYDMLKKNIKEVVGEKKAQQVQDKQAKEQVKEQHITQRMVDESPMIGRGDQVFLEAYSGILFRSNIDYLRLCEAKLQAMMNELAPRDRENDYYDKKVGIPYCEWLSFIGVPKNEWCTPERKDHGWNKGFDKDGLDDDTIAFFTTTTEYEEGKSCIVINWEQDPTDMKLGRLLKGSGL